MSTSYSQAGQDLFVLEQLDHKQGGFFLDIGCAYAQTNNNTYLLESQYNWSGILFDIDPRYTEELGTLRESPFILGDAATMDYITLFKGLSVPDVIDYISLDLDPASNTLKALKALPLDKYKFKVMTFEHDSYSHGEEEAIEAREYLESLGYILLHKDIPCAFGPFEDWYISGETELC